MKLKGEKAANMLVREVGMKMRRTGVRWTICMVVKKSKGIPREKPKKLTKTPIEIGTQETRKVTYPAVARLRGSLMTSLP